MVRWGTALLFLAVSVPAQSVSLAPLVDAQTPRERQAFAKRMAKEGVTLEQVLDAARDFRPDPTRTPKSYTHAPRGVGKRPLIFYLHGSGGRGEEADGLWKTWANGLGAVVVAPTDSVARGGYGFTAEERARAMAALREARRCFDIDENRIWLTGVSRGGHMTWDLGARFPDRWAALAPMIGGPRWLPQRGQNNIRYLENLAHLPMRLLQGEKDQKGLIDNQKFAFVKLARLGAKDAKFVGFADRGHSFGMEAVDWTEFLGLAKRDPLPKKVVRTCASLDQGEGRAFWVDILQLDGRVKEAFTPRVDGRKWPTLDEMGQRAYMDELVAEKTARIEAEWKGKGRFVVKSRLVKRFRLLLTPEMFEEGEPVVVEWNGRTRKKTVKPDVLVLLDEFAERFDRTFLPVAEVRVP